MKDSNHKSQGKKKLLAPALLFIFLICFLFGAYKTFSIVYENKHSNTAYQELREQFREEPASQSAVSDLQDNKIVESKNAETNEKITSAESAVASSIQKLPSNNSKKQQTASIISAKKRQPVDVKKLQETYPKMKAWIYAEGTGIDYPIMQTTDNEYYLTHLYNGSKNSNGSIFLDCRNTGMFTDDNTVIYGHHMKSGAMFYPLMKYKSQHFYETHPTMKIYTEDGCYLVELICGTIEDGDHEFVKFNFDDFDDMKEYVDRLKKRSTFKSKATLLSGDKLVSMCTCTFEKKNARYMVLGRIAGRCD